MILDVTGNTKNKQWYTKIESKAWSALEVHYEIMEGEMHLGIFCHLTNNSCQSLMSTTDHFREELERLNDGLSINIINALIFRHTVVKAIDGKNLVHWNNVYNHCKWCKWFLGTSYNIYITKIENLNGNYFNI